MELQHDVRDFLASRRARLTPEQAGLPAYGGHRRVTLGLGVFQTPPDSWEPDRDRDTAVASDLLTGGALLGATG